MWMTPCNQNVFTNLRIERNCWSCQYYSQMIFYSEYLFVVGIVLGFYGFTRKKQKEKKQEPLTSEGTSITIALAKIKPEVYKGISFVRLSNLPKDQKQVISQTKIKKIKIKTDSSLLTDCVQYLDYERWYEATRVTQSVESISLLEWYRSLINLKRQISNHKQTLKR